MSISFIKIGGSVITDKNTALAAKHEQIAAIAAVIATYHKAHPLEGLVIGTGGGSFGHYHASELPHQNGLYASADATIIHDAVATLNALFVAALREQSISAVSIAANEYAAYVRGKLTAAATDSIARLLDEGTVVCVYGDMVQHGDGQRVVSTEKLFALLAERLSASHSLDKCYLGTNVDGVLDVHGQVISEVSETIADKSDATYDVSGGMRSKVTAALKLAQYFTEVRIVSAVDTVGFATVLRGESLGTRVKP